MKREPDEITKRLAENIQLVRKRLKLTQPGLAAKIGLNGDTVRGWEACRRKADPENIIALANVLGLEGGWLWFYQDHSEEIAALPKNGTEFLGSRHVGTDFTVTDEELRTYLMLKIKAEKNALSQRESEFVEKINRKVASDDRLSFCPPAQLLQAEQEKTVISAALGIREAFLRDQRKAG